MLEKNHKDFLNINNLLKVYTGWDLTTSASLATRLLKYALYNNYFMKKEKQKFLQQIFA